MFFRQYFSYFGSMLERYGSLLSIMPFWMFANIRYCIFVTSLDTILSNWLAVQGAPRVMLLIMLSNDTPF